jgi:hypothetical protein
MKTDRARACHLRAVEAAEGPAILSLRVDAQGYGQAREPNPALRALDGLVGT